MQGGRAVGAQVMLDGNFIHACIHEKCAHPLAPRRRACTHARGTPLGCALFFPLCHRRAAEAQHYAPPPDQGPRRDARRIGAPKDILPKLLGVTEVKTFVTGCVMSELRGLGEEYAGTAAAARKVMLVKCGHDNDRLSAADCIMSVTKGGNGDHFFVATQDSKLRMELRSCIGVPIM